MRRIHDWTPADDALLGTMPDTEAARRIGVGENAARKRRTLLGIPACVPPPRTCRVCEVPAVRRAGFCHTHGERWRRWGKPDPEGWAAAFRDGRLNTCAVCGRHWNGYFGCRHCSDECLAEHRRQAALARWHGKPEEEKRAASERAGRRERERRRAVWVDVACNECGDVFRGPPWRTTCSRPACRAARATRGSRECRARMALAEAAGLAEQLQRRAGDVGTDPPGGVPAAPGRDDHGGAP